MSRLEKFYSNFGGVDSRSNKLNQDPATMRAGSVNFRYNFQDEIQKANGFQHKDDGSSAHAKGLIEYKFTDVNTGESKTEILGVDASGNLNRKLAHFIKLTSTASSSYSFYYDEVSDNFKFVIGANTLTVTLSTTMAQLATSISAIAGHTAIVVDQDGNTVVGSTKLAYLGDCVINASISANSIIHSSFYWETVPFGGAGVPFTTTATLSSNANYSGISYTNLNNSCYISDGGWLMKYDGKSIYRAGMPHAGYPIGTGTSTTGGMSIAQYTTTSVPYCGMTATSFYKYAFQLGFVDHNGVTVLSKVVTGTESKYKKVDGTYPTGEILNDYLSIKTSTPGGGNMAGAQLSISTSVTYDDSFPVYSCVVNGNQNIPDAGGTITVLSGHNIKAGMCLRIPIVNNVTGVTIGMSYLSAKVTSVGATSITVSFGKTGGICLDPYTFSGTAPTTLLVNNQIINAGYTQSSNENKIFSVEQNGGSRNIPTIRFGAFLRVYRTPAMPDDVLTSGFYHLVDLPINKSTIAKTYYDIMPDTIAAASQGFGLSTIALNPDLGSDLPRAGKFISSWQNQLIQAGRPVNEALKNSFYPTYLDPLGGGAPLVNEWGSEDERQYLFRYTESHLNDSQSFYWESSTATEGFPQSGLNEQRIDSKYNDSITGLSKNKDALFVFKDRTTSVHSGTLSTGEIVSEILEGDVGCCSHRSIQEVLGTLIWLDERKGFYSCVAGRLPVHIGYPISDYQRINSAGLNFKTAVSANMRSEALYFCSVGSTTFLLDYAERGLNSNRSCWYIWDRPTIVGILYTADGQLLSSDGTTLWKMKTTNTKYDFTDHKSAISMNVKTAFLSQGVPTIDKHYISWWINSIDGDFTLDTDEYANFIDTVISSYSVAIPAAGSKKFVKTGIKAAIPKLASVSIGFRNAEKNKFVKIQGYELQINDDFDTGEPKK